jgi:hypothetical protein
MSRISACCLLLLNVLLIALIGPGDSLAAESGAEPHASIPSKDLITQDVLDKVPADCGFFHTFLKTEAGWGFHINVIFPPDALTHGYARPLLYLSGTQESRRNDGSRDYFVDVGLTQSSFTNTQRPNAVCDIQFLITIQYRGNKGTGALILPCSAQVTMTPDQHYSYQNVKIDTARTAIVARPKP